jgi:hypothetical protein
VALPERVLGQHDGSPLAPTLLAVARLEFHTPVSQTTSCRTGVTCQPASRIPGATHAKRTEVALY